MAKWKEINTPDPHAIVRAALERAAMCVEGFRGGIYHPEDVAVSIRHIAVIPEAVAEIIAEAAKEGRG